MYCKENSTRLLENNWVSTIHKQSSKYYNSKLSYKKQENTASYMLSNKLMFVALQLTFPFPKVIQIESIYVGRV